MNETSIYSVSLLNAESRRLLESHFPSIWVEGELSNFSQPSSGHWYFSLKDNKAQIRAAMFKNCNRWIKFNPSPGTHILVRGKLSLYEGRGDFQLIVDHMELAGDGLLQKAFDALKRKLEIEGLFATERKRAIPKYPVHIGVITSQTAAALQDVLNVISRRYPGMTVFLYPTPVQGDKAAPGIIQALKKANQQNICEVLLLVRGGGSLEDLQPFNEESVARAIAKSTIPVIAGVGHEIDFTIADFVADQRAPTPSAAAELACPESDTIRSVINRYERRLSVLMESSIIKHQHQIQLFKARLEILRPQNQIARLTQRVDHIDIRLNQLITLILGQKKQQLQLYEQQLQSIHPGREVRETRQKLSGLSQRLISSMNYRLTNQQKHIINLEQQLKIVSPLSIMKRGYAVVRIAKNNQLLKQASQVKPGDILEVQLADGHINASVTQQDINQN